MTPGSVRVAEFCVLLRLWCESGDAPESQLSGLMHSGSVSLPIQRGAAGPTTARQQVRPRRPLLSQLLRARGTPVKGEWLWLIRTAPFSGRGIPGWCSVTNLGPTSGVRRSDIVCTARLGGLLRSHERRAAVLAATPDHFALRRPVCQAHFNASTVNADSTRIRGVLQRG